LRQTVSQPDQTQSRRVRPAACAGRFYPAEAGTLRRLVRDFLKSARRFEGPPPKAIIAPHAGYVYSGPIAGSAYATLGPERDVIRRIVLLGPSHYAPLRGLATCSAAGFATPLGVVPLDREAVAQVESLPHVSPSDDAHEPEHSLEVQLPFLQELLGEFTLVPLLVGDAAPEEVARVLAALWGGPETRIVVSSDLSHYQGYHAAMALDAATAGAIERLQADAVADDGACGCRPVRGLLCQARQLGLKAKTLDLRNSGDTAGPRDQVVGYGAFAFIAG
jgi:AmmeMemoRadiSam system protein B